MLDVHVHHVVYSLKENLTLSAEQGFLQENRLLELKGLGAVVVGITLLSVL